MCGINGVFHYREGVPVDLDLVERQSQLLRHRGPDDEGFHSENGLGMAFRRLAIVDLSTGAQPLANEDQTVWIVYNGEIYNHLDLRRELEARGHRYRTKSDTESIVHAYEEWGDACVERLRGMFAFAIYDRRKRRLLLARDRTGKKPLYYHDDGRRLAFASELKALILDPRVPRELDERALADYLTFQYVPSPRTIWRAVRKLPPAHFLVCDAEGVRVTRYWSLPVDPIPGLEAADCRERLRALLAEAVRVRLMSDVPLGAFLSGGIDSSAVVALMAQAVTEPIKTFSIGFDEEETSELEHARRVARHLGTDHHELIVRPRALELLPRLVWQMDEPFADPSMLPTAYLAEMARSQVTVALSGDGGDEAYAGYPTYPWARAYAGLDWIPRPLRKLLAWPSGRAPAEHPVARRLRRLGMGVADRHLEIMAFFTPDELVRLMAPELRRALGDHDPMAAPRETHARAAAQLGAVPALLHLDAVTYMADDVLVKVDRTSMMHSLEVRCPLLDQQVLEFVARIPFEFKLRGGVTKWVLKECVRDLLPPETLARRKQGFGVPLQRWFGADFGRLARELLSDPRFRGRGWFDRSVVDGLLSRPQDVATTRRIWALVCLELWAQTYQDRPRTELEAPLSTRGRESAA